MTASVFTLNPTIGMTDDPDVVAVAIACHGVESSDTDPAVDKVIIFNDDDEPIWWLNRAQTLALAGRLANLAYRMPEDPRPLKRRPEVDDHFRGSERTDGGSAGRSLLENPPILPNPEVLGGTK